MGGRLKRVSGGGGGAQTEKIQKKRVLGMEEDVVA